MTQSHRTLTKNVDISMQRVDRTREWKRQALSTHRRHRVLNPLLWVTSPFSFMVVFGAWPVWAFVLFVVAIVGIGVMGWRDLRRAKFDLERHAEDERIALSNLCDDLQRVNERETLKLLDPEAYEGIESRAREEMEEQRRQKEEYQRKRLTMPRHTGYVHRVKSGNKWYSQDEDGDWEVIRSW
jgi:hypothetical protein